MFWMFLCHFHSHCICINSNNNVLARYTGTISLRHQLAYAQCPNHLATVLAQITSFKSVEFYLNIYFTRLSINYNFLEQLRLALYSQYGRRHINLISNQQCEFSGSESFVRNLPTHRRSMLMSQMVSSYFHFHCVCINNLSAYASFIYCQPQYLTSVSGLPSNNVLTTWRDLYEYLYNSFISKYI